MHLESEGARDTARKEVQAGTNKYSDKREEFRMREKDLRMAVDEASKNELKLADKLKNLENVLDHANQVCFDSPCLWVFVFFRDVG